MLARFSNRPFAVRAAFASALALSSISLVVTACSSSDDDRPSFTASEDAGEDASEASLPPTNDVEDAGPDTATVVDAAIAFDGSDDPVVCGTSPCVKQLVGGDTYFCGLLDDGTVRCWGTDYRGSLGRTDLDAAADAAVTPAPVPGLANVVQLSARSAICATVEGEGPAWDAGADASTDAASDASTDDAGEARHVECWGSNDRGQLGVRVPAASDTLAHPTPTPVALPENAARVDMSDFSTCAVLASGKLACWGSTLYGSLARPATGSFALPGIANVGSDLVRSSTAMALNGEGELVTWSFLAGRSSSLVPSDPNYVPLPNPSLGKVHDFASESPDTFYDSNLASFVPVGHACAIVQGEVYCWGTRNTWGALCTGISNNEPAPVRISLPEADGGYAKQITVSRKNTCARLSDGTVQCCGADHRGQLGRGAVTDGGLTVDGGVPIEPTFTAAKAVTSNVVRVVLGGDTACALVEDGSVECWGSNEYGQLGQGTRDTDPHPSPVKVQF